jgi:amidase
MRSCYRTETDGSIVCPASVNGIVELNLLLVLVNIWNYSLFKPKIQDQWRELLQMLAIVNVIAIDESDPVTLESKGKIQKDYTSFCS